MSDTTIDGLPIAAPVADDVEDSVEPTEENTPLDMSVEEQRRSFAINVAVTLNQGGGIDKLLTDSEQIEEYLRTGTKQVEPMA